MTSPAVPADGMPEELLVWDESEDTAAHSSARPWSVLVVDDDEGVHNITRLVLSGLTFRDRPVQMISAYSAAQCLEVLQARPDVALVLLDVVMETDDAGLRTVRAVREELGNANVRLVLRTGQPGYAPEREVVTRYEVDGYALKTEVTSQGLITAVIASLRAFALLQTLEQQRLGLTRIVDATADLACHRTMRSFARGTLEHLEALVPGARGSVFCAPTGGVGAPRAVEVLAGAGRYAGWTGQMLHEVDIERQVSAEVDGALAEGAPSAAESSGGVAIALGAGHAKRGAIWLGDVETLDRVAQQLLDVFCAKVAVAFDNVQLIALFRKAQEATVFALADLAEYRDTDTGEHVLRVARTTDLLARELHAAGSFPTELDELLVEQIGLASMLHDVGKVSIPDAILLKPGALDTEERRLMETHAGVGKRILARADQIVGHRSYLTLAAEIAVGHHEWVDGTGYPHRVAGSSIPLSARITAVADVFDALTHARPYKAPWSHDDAVAYIRGRAGTQFDPVIVAAFERVLSSPAWTTPFQVPDR